MIFAWNLTELTHLMNGLAHHNDYNHLGEYTFILRSILSHLKLLFYFSMKFLFANRTDQNNTETLQPAECGVTSGTMSYKYDARLI